MSLVLAIETSNPTAGRDAGAVRGRASAGVAIGRLGASLEVLGFEPLVRGGDEELMPAIDRIVRSAGGVPKDITRIGVSIGPGGFTGIRIAVASAKMIAEATGAACVAIPSAQVVARRVSNDGRPFAVALASKRDTIHLTPFGATGACESEGAICTGEALEALALGRLIADDHLPESIRAIAQTLGIAIECPNFDPVACLELVAIGEPCDALSLRPFYPREPEAVTRWRELHPRD